jgi:hypothetical protein
MYAIEEPAGELAKISCAIFDFVVRPVKFEIGATI